MKILITGSDGYLGKSLVLRLSQKYEITSVGRKNFDLSNSSETFNFFRGNFFDVVLHCAVSGGSRLKTDDFGVMDNNIKMYYNLLSCKDKFGKLIHFGSGAEIYQPESPYGLSKKIISKSISERKNFYNLRIFSVFDENELETRFIKSSIRKYINNFSIDVFENFLMDFFYMEDLISLVDYYINNDPPKDIDCVYEKTLDLIQISEIINNLEIHKVPINLIKEGGSKKYSGNFKNLGLSFIGLEEGIKKTYFKLKYNK